jgi:recombination protein RecA
MYGDFSEIPLQSKKPGNEDMTRIYLDCIDEPIEGPYCGFTLEGDGLFLIGDHFVTHNTTTLAYIIAEIQKTESPYVIFYHTEESRKPEKSWELAGVDPSKVIYIDARKFGEDGINMVREILIEENGLPNKLIGLVVIDSMAALAPSAEIDSIDNNGMEGATMARLAALSSKLFRVMCGQGWLSEGCMLGIVNQFRSTISSTGNSPDTTTGGRALQYYCKIRVTLRSGSKDFLRRPAGGGEITLGQQDPNAKLEIVGHRINYYVQKNNTGSSTPYKRGSWDVIYNVGIDCVSPIITEAIEYGIIQTPNKMSYIVRSLDEENNIVVEKVTGRPKLNSLVSSSKQLQEDLQLLNSRIRNYLQTVEFTNDGGTYIIDNEQVDLLEFISKAPEKEIQEEESVVLMEEIFDGE